MGLRKNVISNFILSSSTIFFPLITFPYITRTLSETNVGKVFFIDAFTQYFIIFSSIGIPFYGIREIAKVKNNTQERSKLVIELLVIQVSFSILYSVIFLLLHFFVPKLHNELPLIKIGCLSLISNSFLIEWFYQGIESFTYITVRSLIVKFVCIIAILLFVKQTNDHAIYYLLLTLVTLANAVFNFSNFFKNYYEAVDFKKLFLKKHLQPLFILFSINISLSIYTIMDTIILGLLTDDQNVSFYNVPLRIVKMFWLVVGSVGTVLIPRVSTLFINQDMVGIEQLIKKSLSIVFLLTLPFCFFCLNFPTEILHIISGNKYVATANALRVLSIIPLIIGVCNVLGAQFLLPIGSEKKVLYATFWGLIVSLAFNFLLIPHIKYMGSCLACVAGELAVCAYVFLSARKRTKIFVDQSLILQILTSILCCFLYSLIAKGHFNNYLLLASTCLTYISAMLLLQFFIFKNKFLFSLLTLKRN